MDRYFGAYSFETGVLHILCFLVPYQLSSTEAFYKYLRETVVPQVKVGDWYNGQQPFGLRGFINDRVNRIMGYAVMRQIRAKPSQCLFLAISLTNQLVLTTSQQPQPGYPLLAKEINYT